MSALISEEFRRQLREYEGNKALNYIFSFIDDLFLAGKFNECDVILEDMDLNYITPTNAIGILAITLVAKGKLKNRKAYFESVKSWLELIEPDRAKKLLKGLE